MSLSSKLSGIQACLLCTHALSRPFEANLVTGRVTCLSRRHLLERQGGVVRLSPSAGLCPHGGLACTCIHATLLLDLHLLPLQDVPCLQHVLHAPACSWQRTMCCNQLPLAAARAAVHPGLGCCGEGAGVWQLVAPTFDWCRQQALPIGSMSKLATPP